MKRKIILVLIISMVVISTSCVFSPECGNGIIEGGETQETCCIDAGCYGEQTCENNICVNPTCDYCQYLENYICKDYNCCQDNDCNENEFCEENECKIIECDCGKIENHECTKYQCCSDNDCDEDEHCRINDCEDIECDCGKIIDQQCIEYECCFNRDCGDDEYCDDNVCKEEEYEEEEPEEELMSEFSNISVINSVDTLLFSMESLDKNYEFYDTIDSYINTVAIESGLVARFIDLDSSSVQDKFGTKVSDIDNWLEIEEVLQEVINEWNPSFIIILGGEDVVPMPVVEEVLCSDEGSPSLPSDIWYIDSNDDQVADSGITISRIPDYQEGSSNIIKALETAIELHEQGGLDTDNQIAFSGNCDSSPITNCYDSPPYCVYDADGDCYDIEVMYDLISEQRLIEIGATHGSPTTLTAIDGSGATIFSVNYFDNSMLNLNSRQMFVIASGCNAGRLNNNENFAVELLSLGASIVIARGETYYGYHVGLYDNFYNNLNSGSYIGEEFTEEVRDAAESNCQYISSAHVHLYGDPTIKVK